MNTMTTCIFIGLKQEASITTKVTLAISAIKASHTLLAYSQDQPSNQPSNHLILESNSSSWSGLFSLPVL